MEDNETLTNIPKKKLNLTYAYADYTRDGSIYIAAMLHGELYAEITVNLSSYGLHLKGNQVMVPTYKLDADVFFSFVDDLAERIVTRIGYGPFDAYGDIVELKKDWKDKAVPLEEYYKTYIEE